jgi:hypothetical protein
MTVNDDTAPDSDTDPTDDQNGDGDQEPETGLSIEDALTRREQLYGLAGTDDDLDIREPGDDQEREFLLSYGPRGEEILTAIDLDTAEKAKAAEVATKDAERARVDAAKAEIEKKRQQDADAAEEERIRAKAQAELDATPDEPDDQGPDIGAVVSQEVREKVNDELKALRKVPRGPEFEERWGAVQEYLHEADALAETMTAPGVTAAERIDSWDEADPHTREVASRVFGTVGPFDLDVGSEMYASAVEAAKDQVASDAEWVAQQRANRRSR